MKNILFFIVAIASFNAAYAGWDDNYGDDKSIHDDQPRTAFVDLKLK